MSAIGALKGYLYMSNSSLGRTFVEFIDSRFNDKSEHGYTLYNVFESLKLNNYGCLYAMLKSVIESDSKRYKFLESIYDCNDISSVRVKRFLMSPNKWLAEHNKLYDLIPEFYHSSHRMLNGTNIDFFDIETGSSLKEVSFQRMNRAGGVVPKQVPSVLTKKKIKVKIKKEK